MSSPAAPAPTPRPDDDAPDAPRPPGVPDDRSSNVGEEDPGAADDTTLGPATGR